MSKLVDKKIIAGKWAGPTHSGCGPKWVGPVWPKKFSGQLLTSPARCRLHAKVGQNGPKFKKILKFVIYLIYSFFK